MLDRHPSHSTRATPPSNPLHQRTCSTLRDCPQLVNARFTALRGSTREPRVDSNRTSTTSTLRGGEPSSDIGHTIRSRRRGASSGRKHRRIRASTRSSAQVRRRANRPPCATAAQLGEVVAAMRDVPRLAEDLERERQPRTGRQRVPTRQLLHQRGIRSHTAARFVSNIDV
jgi:hypothetical protein